MSRFVKWVTLTPEERQQVMPAFQSAGEAYTESGPLIQSHNGSVTLPNGQPCPFVYTHYGLRSHRFAFQEPVQQQLWHSDPLANTTVAIEEQAQEFAPVAFRLAHPRQDASPP